MHTVYGLIDPRTNAVFYVGRSKNERERLYGHLCDPASSAWKTCQDLKDAGIRPALCVFGRFENKQDARTLEAQLTVLLPGLVNSKSRHMFPMDDEWRRIKGGEEYSVRERS